MKNIKNKLVFKAITARQTAREKAKALSMLARAKMADESGSVSEHAIVIIIGVVLGGLLLVGLIALMNNVILPSTESKVTSMFAMG